MEVDNCTLELKSSLKYYFAEEKQEHDYSQTAKAALYIVYLPSNLLVSANINEMTWKQQQQQKMITVSLKKMVKCRSQLQRKVESRFWFTVVST